MRGLTPLELRLMADAEHPVGPHCGYDGGRRYTASEEDALYRLVERGLIGKDPCMVGEFEHWHPVLLPAGLEARRLHRLATDG